MAVDSTKPCYIHGIAYNQGMKYRITDTLDPKIENPHTDPGYLMDPAVRLTHKQMEQDLTGIPMLIEHNWKNGPVAHIVHNWLDEKNRLNIIAEIPQSNDLGKWVVRQVRAGIFEDLSIGYDTRVEKETRKVSHMGIEEVSFVTGGYFYDCKVKARASKKFNYKHSGEDFDFEQKKKNSFLQILTDMATNGQTPASDQGGPQPMDTDPPASFSNSEQVEMLQALVKMKKEIEAYKKKEEVWTADKEILENLEKKRRAEYAKKQEPVYQQTMEMVEELTKTNGGVLSDGDRKTLNELAFNPEGEGVFGTLVAATASARSLKLELDKITKENEELKKNHELTRDLLKLDQPSLRHTQKRPRDIPMSNVMQPDTDSVATPPSWIQSLLNIPDTALRVHGLPKRRAVAPPNPIPSPAPSHQAPPSMKTGGQTPPQQDIQKVAATAGVHQRYQSTSFKGSNPSIKYPENSHSMRNRNTHSDIWEHIRNTGAVTLDRVGAHIAGKDFTESH